MGWSSWFGSKGNQTSTKTEKTKDGGSKTHFLGEKGGSKKNHTHVIVHKDSSGKSFFAQGNPRKDKRK